MDRTTFEAADPILDDIAEVLGQLLLSSELAQLRSTLAKLDKAMGERYSISLGVTVDVGDNERERYLHLMQTGLSGFDQEEPYQTWGDSTLGKYISEGEIEIVPHDRCPRCWELWDFKFGNRSCEHCGATLGRNVKVLLDTDVCPNCENGKVTISNPKCSECGHEVDLDLVEWG